MGAPPGVALAFAERAAKPAIYSEAAVGEIPRWAADRQNFVRERAGKQDDAISCGLDNGAPEGHR
jgi:hypothetical protein